MSRFKKGNTVWMGRGENAKKMIVDRVIDNPHLPIYQYTFEAPYNTFACGEQSIRKTQHGKDLKLSECFKEDQEKVPAININTIANGKSHSMLGHDNPFGEKAWDLFPESKILFRPNLAFAKWIADYANGRLCIEVGCGQGHLLRMLKFKKARVMGIEPHIDVARMIEHQLLDKKIEDVNVNEILQRRIEDCASIINGLGNRAMLIITRPKDTDYTYTAINNMKSGMEALFITTEDDFNLFNYLKEYKQYATKIKHEGISEDNEIVFSIIKP